MGFSRSFHLPERRQRVPRSRRGQPVPPSAEELEQRTLPALMRPVGLIVHPVHEIISPNYSGTQNPAGFWPAQVRHAYGFDQLKLDGTGETIAIVDAYGDPNLASDLATFDAQFNLSAPPSFTQVTQTGGSAANLATDPTGGWEVEEALDVEWAHAIAPGANILVVEANSADTADLLAAVDQARNTAGVVAVSMSWGGSEFQGETGDDSHFTTPSGHAGITFVGASGDSGTPATWPGVSPNVLAVGGTTLTLDGSDNITSEIGWSGSGGGYSQGYSVPSYQSTYANSSYVQNTLGNKVLLDGARGNPDVAYAADASPGFAVYDTFPFNYGTEVLDWAAVGGTSDAAPQWAALVALADQGRGASGSLDGFSQTLPALYQLAASPTSYANDFNDIQYGSNGEQARPGYDLVTGLGTPKANNLIPDLEKAGISTTFSVTVSSSTPTAGTPFSVTVTAQNSSGQTLTGYTGTVHFTTTDAGKGVLLPGDYTFTAADNGSHTFSNGVTLVTAGSQTITASDASNTAITGSAAVTVSPASAASLSVSAPTSSSQGAPFNVTVSAKDAYGNTATGYSGTVHFTTSDTGSGVALPSDYTFTGSDKGSHTFSNGVTLVTVGSQTVKATDTVSSSLTASASVTVTAPSPATQLSVSAPASATAGSAFSVTVTALDANNNTATGYLGTVHFTTSDTGSGVALPTDYTFTAADHGVHTFTSAVTLVTAGSQTVTATDKGSSGVKGSATVTVNPAAAASLSVAGFPSPINAGTSGNFTVTAKDAYGNTATGYSGTVTFTSSDAHAVLPANSTLTKGTGTFSATFQTVGTQSLTATDTATKSITGTQSGITVNKASVPAPTVLGLSATSGSIAGGYTLLINGTNLGGATQVFFGSTPAVILGDSGTTIGVTVPAHAAGTVDVTVVTPGGTSATSAADRFTFVGNPGSSAPTVQSVSPNLGSTAGGYTVAVYGTNLSAATAVYFGTTPATIFGISANALGVVVPAHAAGAVDVTVVTPVGTSATSPADRFTYVSFPAGPAPTVQSVTPNAGPSAGGQQVVIYGTNLSAATAAYFGSTRAVILGVTPTAIGVTVPAHAAGVVDVTVVTAAGTSATSTADHYTYQNGPLAKRGNLAVVDAALAGWSPKTATQQQIEYLIAEILTGGGGTQGIAPLTKKGH